MSEKEREEKVAKAKAKRRSGESRKPCSEGEHGKEI